MLKAWQIDSAVVAVVVSEDPVGYFDVKDISVVLAAHHVRPDEHADFGRQASNQGRLLLILGTMGVRQTARSRR